MVVIGYVVLIALCIRGVVGMFEDLGLLEEEEEERKTPKTQDEARRAYSAYSGEEFFGEDLSGQEREDLG